MLYGDCLYTKSIIRKCLILHLTSRKSSSLFYTFVKGRENEERTNFLKTKFDMYVGLIWRMRTAEAILHVGIPLREHCSYCDRSTMHAVAAAYPQSILNGIPTCTSLIGILRHAYDTKYVAGRRNLDVNRWNHVNATKSYLHFDRFVREAIFCSNFFCFSLFLDVLFLS